MSTKNLVILLIVVIVVALGVYYFSYQKGYKVGFERGKEVGRAAAKVEAGEAVVNPFEGIPSANPFEDAINPFRDLYKNPFK